MLRVEKEEFTKARNSKELFQAFETPTDSTRPTQKGSMCGFNIFSYWKKVVDPTWETFAKILRESDGNFLPDFARNWEETKLVVTLQPRP